MCVWSLSSETEMDWARAGKPNAASVAAHAQPKRHSVQPVPAGPGSSSVGRDHRACSTLNAMLFLLSGWKVKRGQLASRRARKPHARWRGGQARSVCFRLVDGPKRKPASQTFSGYVPAITNTGNAEGKIGRVLVAGIFRVFSADGRTVQPRRTFVKMSTKTCLPQIDDGLFLTDGGLETTLIFHEGWSCRISPPFTCSRMRRARAALRTYSRATWRSREAMAPASCWKARPGGRAATGATSSAIRARRSPRPTGRSIALMGESGAEYETAAPPMVISGCVGPRGDGYDPGKRDERGRGAGLSRARRSACSPRRASTWSAAITMTNVNEAIGVTRAAQAAGMPVAISFTVETDGRLPTGRPGRGDHGGRRARPARGRPTT